MHYSDGQIEGGTPNLGEAVQYISDKEYAEAIQKRIAKYGVEDTSRDIYVTTGCYGHTFGRNVSQRLAAANLVTPITVSVSEYGQYGFSAHTKEESVLVKVLGLGKRGIKLGYVQEHEKEYGKSNASVYVPDPVTGKPRQVTKAEKRTGPQSAEV